jgi:hypothetical protein
VNAGECGPRLGIFDFRRRADTADKIVEILDRETTSAWEVTSTDTKLMIVSLAVDEAYIRGPAASIRENIQQDGNIGEESSGCIWSRRIFSLESRVSIV